MGVSEFLVLRSRVDFLDLFSRASTRVELFALFLTRADATSDESILLMLRFAAAVLSGLISDLLRFGRGGRMVIS